MSERFRENPPPWRCFHCGEVFGHEVQAAMHFGATPAATPVCRIARSDWPLMYAYRDLEQRLAFRISALREALVQVKTTHDVFAIRVFVDNALACDDERAQPEPEAGE